MSQDQTPNDADDDEFEESAEEFVKNYTQKPGFRGDYEGWCGESHVMSKKPRPKEGMAAKAKRLRKQRDRLVDNLKMLLRNTRPWSKEDWPNGLQQMDRLSEKIAAVNTYIGRVIGGMGFSTATREVEQIAETHGVPVRPTGLASDPSMSMATLLSYYDKGYQLGYEETLEGIEAKTKARGLANTITQQGRWLPPRIRTREDFAGETDQHPPDHSDELRAWLIGYFDAMHVARVDAGTPCENSDCRLCHPPSDPPHL